MKTKRSFLKLDYIRSFQRKKRPRVYDIPTEDWVVLRDCDKEDINLILDILGGLKNGTIKPENYGVEKKLTWRKYLKRYKLGPLPKREKKFIPKFTMPEKSIEEIVKSAIFVEKSPPKPLKTEAPSTSITPNIDKKAFIEGEFTIVDKENKEIPFRLNSVQQKYYNALTTEYGSGMDGAREIILKARQEGFSSLILAMFACDFITIPNSVSICISHNRGDTEKLFRKVHHYIESYCRKNGFDPKQYLSMDTKAELENATNKAFFYIRTAGSKIGGRGGTATNIHFCLSKNQKVIGKDGYVYPICGPPKHILDGNGSLIKVFGVAKKKCDQDMKRIFLYGNLPFPIEGTQDHKLLCRSGNNRLNSKGVWKFMKDITNEDYVAFPITNIIRSFKQNKFKKHGKITIEMDESFGEFLGWYISEGSLGSGRVDLTINKNEVKYISHLLNKLKSYFSSYSVYDRGGSNGRVISIMGTQLRDFVEFTMGRVDKRIPDSFFLYGKDFLRGLLRGLFLGDGTFSCQGQASFTSWRSNLIIQVKRLLISLRIGYPSIYIKNSCETVGFGRKIHTKESWTIMISGSGYTRLRKFLGFVKENRVDGRSSGYNKYWKHGVSYNWIKVHHVEDMDREEEVFDIILNKDPHSFCLISGVSSNSEAAFFESTEKITATEIIEATIQQVPQGKGMIFLESTGGDYGTYFQMAWEKAKRNEIIYKPRFFSWEEFYNDEFIEKKRLEYQTEEKFLTDYPKTDEEAFIHTGSPFFDRKILKWMRDNLQREPLRMGRLASDGEMI